jgi:ribosomal protein L24
MIKYGDNVRVISGFYEGQVGKAMAYQDSISAYIINLKDGNSIEVSSTIVEKVEG